ncbi:hypothetical protein GOV14_00555 [Candidatus Pacearchaeota archaeon]|nr:hypothetical protein [Candidatus Pacearchaeota archaeon]
MEELQIIDHFSYGPFMTVVKASRLVLDFLEGEDIELTKNIDVDEWYRGWLLTLDKNKDGCVDKEFGEDFELIYCGVIENPEDFMDKESIAEDLDIIEENILSDGSQPIFENTDNKVARFWVRWIIVKK